MNLSAPFIVRPVATLLISLAILLVGALSFGLLPVSPLPNMDFPAITVQASLPGASPQIMASTVATPLERALGGIAGINEMTSRSSQGNTRIILVFDLDRDINGRDVLIVEDIIDSGLTLSWLLRNLATRNPRSLRVCTLLRKPDAVRAELEVEYVGFDIPTEFVVGYGLDYAERYRDLPYIGTLEPKVYETP